jgi:hypothetical protein
MIKIFNKIAKYVRYPYVLTLGYLGLAAAYSNDYPWMNFCLIMLLLEFYFQRRANVI